MRSVQLRLRCASAAVLSCVSAPLLGQVYPTKPVRIVTSGVGGSSDVVARLLAQGLTSSFGQQVLVDNRASGVIPGQIVSKAAPDGYTLLLAAGTFTVGPLLEKTPYDPIKDFAPITLAANAPNVLVVHPSLPVNSVRELIAYAKARPGVLNYSSGPPGSATQLASELFNYMAGTKIQGIPYSSGASRMSALMGGEVQLEFSTAGAVSAHIKSGKLRALAVTSAQPSALFPGLPTVAASGVPGYEAGLFTALFAPADTAAALILRLNQEVVRLLSNPELKERLAGAGLECVGSSPEQLGAAMKSEMARMGKVIKEAGIRAS